MQKIHLRILQNLVSASVLFGALTLALPILCCLESVISLMSATNTKCTPMEAKHSEPSSDYYSPLIWVHIVCNIGYQSTKEQNNICHEWWEEG